MRSLHVLEWLEQLGLAGRDVHPVDAGHARILQPDLVVDRPVLRADQRLLGIVLQQAGRQLPHLERLGLLVELGRAGLEHEAEP